MRAKISATISSVVSVAVVLIVIAIISALKYEIPKPENWPANVRLYRKSLGGETSVYDAESGKLIFTYRPEYDPNVHPVKVEELDPDHWHVVFEAPKKQSPQP
jgi:hypothetical protein